MQGGSPVTVLSSSGQELFAPALYPGGAAALVAGSGNVAAAVAAATLTPSAATKTAYISGFCISGAGATAALPVVVSVTGLLGGTRSFIYNFASGVLVGNQPLNVAFFPPLPASAVNVTIAVSCPSGGGGNTNNSAVAWGFEI